MRTVSDAERRATLVARHRLDGSASGVVEAVRSVVALHATDPASVHLSVLARSATTTLEDVTTAFSPARDLVRWMAMRRTVFAFERADVPVVQAAVSSPLAEALRRRLLARIVRNGVDPAIDGDPAALIAELEDRVVDVVHRLGPLTGAQLRREVPELGTVIRARAASETPQALTSPLVTAVSTAGRLVRGVPTGAWTSRQHRWESAEVLWPGGLPEVDAAEARKVLARRWLERFGPATSEDLEWWTGWTRRTALETLRGLELEEVDLGGRPGLDLPRDASEPAPRDVAALLPALDPTPMGWKHRAWFTAVDPARLYDRAGNIGPTAWWDGELVGGWASTASGVRVSVLADRGAEAAAAIEHAAGRLEERLGGTVVTPAARTPLERELAG